MIFRALASDRSFVNVMNTRRLFLRMKDVSQGIMYAMLVKQSNKPYKTMKIALIIVAYLIIGGFVAGIIALVTDDYELREYADVIALIWPLAIVFALLALVVYIPLRILGIY